MNLARPGRCRFWYRGAPGSYGNINEMRQQWRERADVILLLRSDDLYLDQIEEVRQSLAQRERGAIVIPIALRRPTVDELPDMVYAPLPSDRAVSEMQPDEAWLKVGEGLRLVLERIEKQVPLLFLAANPEGTARLALDREFTEIRQRVRQSPNAERLRLLSRWDVLGKDLQEALARYHPAVVHFSGHGARDGALQAEKEPEAGAARDLAVAAKTDETGGAPRPGEITPQALAELFRLMPGVRCVVLNACHSSEGAKLIAQHVDCVISMTRAIGDLAAICLSDGLYRALAQGDDVKRSFELALGQVMLRGLPATDVPQLDVRPGLDPKTVRIV